MCLESIWEFLNSNFITAFFGAIFGSGTILLISYFDKRRETLADINASIAILSGLTNAYLMIKKQHSKPVLEAYQKDVNNFNNTRENGDVLELQAYLKKYHCPNLDYEIPMKNTLSLAGKHAYVIPYLMRAKKSAGEVEEACQIWNKEAENLFNLENQERVLKYLGLKRQDGIRDTTFPDTIENLNGTVDDALFFTDLAVLALQKAGKAALPWPYKSRIIKLKIEDSEYQNLMPSKNHKPGWGDGQQKLTRKNISDGLEIMGKYDENFRTEDYIEIQKILKEDPEA